jgi:hypothetical protein
MKPRNYFVVHAHRRKAGAHMKTRKAQRNKSKRELNKQIKRTNAIE